MNKHCWCILYKDYSKYPLSITENNKKNVVCLYCFKEYDETLYCVDYVYFINYSIQAFKFILRSLYEKYDKYPGCEIEYNRIHDIMFENEYIYNLVFDNK